MKLIDINDSQSYEDWMNDMATDDRKMPRGWQAVWQIRCDKCARFVNENGPGVSWSQDWSYDYDGTPCLHDATWRCSRCTDKHGIQPSNCDESRGKYHGRNPKEAA